MVSFILLNLKITIVKKYLKHILKCQDEKFLNIDLFETSNILKTSIYFFLTTVLLD